MVFVFSVLKEKYRKSFIYLNFQLVYIKINTLQHLVESQKGKNFMRPSLLESQIKILEESKKLFKIDSILKVNYVI